MLNKDFMSHYEFGDEPTLIPEDPQKSASRENFQRSDRKQDSHTGKKSSGRGGIGQKKSLKSTLARHEGADEEHFTKEQIAQGIDGWKNRKSDSYWHKTPDFIPDHYTEHGWENVWEEIKRTSWENAVENYRGIEEVLSKEEYVSMQQEIRDELKELGQEETDERKLRNFSQTGDPGGDKNRTSLTH